MTTKRRAELRRHLTNLGHGQAETENSAHFCRRLYPVSDHLRALDPGVVLVVGSRVQQASVPGRTPPRASPRSAACASSTSSSGPADSSSARTRGSRATTTSPCTATRCPAPTKSLPGTPPSSCESTPRGGCRACPRCPRRTPRTGPRRTGRSRSRPATRSRPDRTDSPPRSALPAHRHRRPPSRGSLPPNLPKLERQRRDFCHGLLGPTGVCC